MWQNTLFDAICCINMLLRLLLHRVINQFSGGVIIYSSL
nr:MAG TPA: hypothetical protein [Caudoviricetes sp.]